MDLRPLIPQLTVLAEVLFVQFILVGGLQRLILRSRLWKRLGGVEQNILVHIPSLVVPLLILFLFGMDLEKHGISIRNANLALLIGLSANLPALVARLPIALTDYTKLSGGSIIAVVHLLALTLWAWRFQGDRDFILGIVTIFLSVVGFWWFAHSRKILPKMDRIALSFAGMLFAALCEEVLWRGYIQTRLNEVFGYPFSFFGIQYGWGLVITSVLFGFVHVLNPNPTTQKTGWYWGWGLWTTCAGLFYGLVREKTGGILAPFLVHGLPQAIAIALGL